MKVRSNIKTYNEQKLLRIWKDAPLVNTSLFTLKFEILFQFFKNEPRSQRPVN